MLRVIIVSIAILTFACANNIATSQGSPASTPAAVSDGSEKKLTSFDGQRAFAHVKAQVDFGPRPAGSPALEKTRAYLQRELESYGLKTTLDSFTPVTPHGKVKMKNIIAELPGESSDVIMIASHYDTKYFKEFTFVGANDGGSSTGVLLEIARTMAADSAAGRAKHRFTYQFVFFDGEEAYCREWSECLNGHDNTYGSRHLVERLKKEKQLDRVKALILLDMIGDKDLKIPREENSSRRLVDAIWSTARENGYARYFPAEPQSVTDDHIPFLEAGVNAVDLIDLDYGVEENTFWHTEQDTLDKISARSLEIVGEVVLQSLPRIEAQIR
ncbi:MAG: M28 family peptidase [Blastocatellia bacterium]|nr:M28 family peptidase [Blastocatellia bacterium]